MMPTHEDAAIARDAERRSWPRAKRKRPGTNLCLPPAKVGDEHDPAPGTYRDAALAAGLSLSAWAERAMDKALAEALAHEAESGAERTP